MTRIIPSATSVRSNSQISSYARCHCSSVAKPSTRSTSTRPYQDRSSTAIPPQPGSDGQNRQRKWCRFSSWVGAAKEATRTCRGSSGAVSRLMQPPLPEASQPSKTTQSGGPSPGSIPSWPPRESRSQTSRVWAAANRSASSARLSLSPRSSMSSRPATRPASPAPTRQASEAGQCPGSRRSTQTSLWSEVGNGKTPTSRKSGSSVVGQKTPDRAIRSDLRGST